MGKWLERKLKVQDYSYLAPWGWCGIFHRHPHDFQLGPDTLCPSGFEKSQKEKHASHSMDSSFLITAWPKSATATGTWQEIHEVIAWSFAALFQGFHPEADWKGRALPAKLARLARKPITTAQHCFWEFNFRRPGILRKPLEISPLEQT